MIGCRNTAELWLLRPALARLRRTRPEVLPVLRLVPFDALENLLEEESIHLMFTFQESAPSKARYLELTRCPVMCICAPGHPLAEEQTVTSRQLQAAERIAACRPPACPRELFEIQGRVMGGRSTNQILFCDNQEAIYPLVEAGYAFALVPDFPHSRVPQLRYIPMADAEPLSFSAAYLSEKEIPPWDIFSLTCLKVCRIAEKTGSKRPLFTSSAAEDAEIKTSAPFTGVTGSGSSTIMRC